MKDLYSYDKSSGAMKWIRKVEGEYDRCGDWRCVVVSPSRVTISYGSSSSIVLAWRLPLATFATDAPAAHSWISKNFDVTIHCALIRAVEVLLNGPGVERMLPAAPPPPPPAFHAQAYYCNWVFYTGYWVKVSPICEGKTEPGKWNCLKYEAQQEALWQAIKEQVGIELPRPAARSHDFAKAFFHRFPGGLVFTRESLFAGRWTWFPHDLPPVLEEVAQWPVDRGE